MTQTAGKCDHRQLRGLVEGGLSTKERKDREDHLAICEKCREELKELAGDDSWWSGVKEYLKPGDLDPPSGSLSEWGIDSEQSPSAIDLTFLGPTDDPAMLGRLAGYEIAGVIGQGGMGLVLKGFDGALNRYCAIKVLAPHLATSGAARRRFQREAKAAAAVMHENVVAIHSVSPESSSLPYLIMPYLRGKSLERRLRDEGPLPVEQVLRIGMQIAQGLAAAHAQGLVHRDIKPSNILLADDVERVAITDFGLARAADDASLTRSGWIAGTPQYMSPEQAKGDAIDPRSDLFSLGSLMYAMCAGRPPFRAESSYGVIRKIIETEPRDLREINPSIPAWLTGVIAKLMEKSPEKRFQSATEAAETMRHALAHVQAPAVTPLPKDVARLSRDKGNRKRIWLFVLSIALSTCGILMSGAIWFQHYYRRNPPTHSPPEIEMTLNNTAWDSGLDEELPYARQRAAALSDEIGELTTEGNNQPDPNP